MKNFGADYYVINGQTKADFLTLFAIKQNVCFYCLFTSTSKHKVLIIDEADNTTNDVQLLLRASIEELKTVVLSSPAITRTELLNLCTRDAVVDFGVSGKDKQQLAGQFFKRINQILGYENVEFEMKVIAELIQKFFPDWRRRLMSCKIFCNW